MYDVVVPTQEKANEIQVEVAEETFKTDVETEIQQNDELSSTTVASTSEAQVVTVTCNKVVVFVCVCVSFPIVRFVMVFVPQTENYF